jgi:hypothetical protein
MPLLCFDFASNAGFFHSLRKARVLPLHRWPWDERKAILFKGAQSGPQAKQGA